MAIHTYDWDRQSLQPLFEMASAVMPCELRLVVVGDGRDVMQLSNVRLWLDLVTIPAVCISSAWRVTGEVRRFGRLRRVQAPTKAMLDLDRRGVVAVWRGDPTTVSGGSVTHASGMLGALRRQGLRVCLVTVCPPPKELEVAVDEVEVANPLPRGSRVTREIEDICLNRALVVAAERALGRFRPAFVYQRSDAFLTCGMTISVRHDLPLVLEWNGSALWARHNWRVRHRVKDVFDGFLTAVENESLARSVLVRAVSERAAEMAVENGAPPQRVVTIANGVDIRSIPAPAALDRRAHAPVIGWVGTFGPWHGAPLLIQAMARLPDARAVLVGDGAQRAECMALARDLGVSDRIEWTGQLPHDQAIARISACDVLASPHVPAEGRAFFGSPTKIFEFMAIGRPIVASTWSRSVTCSKTEERRCLCDPGILTTSSQGYAISQQGRTVLRQALGGAARAEAEAHHTWDQRARELLRALQASVSPVSYPHRASVVKLP